MARTGKSRRRLKSLLFSGTIATVFFSTLAFSLREPPPVRIAEIAPRMSFSSVRISGILERGALEMRDGSRLYLLADETGSIPVFLQASEPAQQLSTGDAVAFEGRLGLATAHRASLKADSVEVLAEHPPATIQGRVKEVRSPTPGSRGPYRLVLERSEGRIEVIHWFPPDYHASAGDRVTAVGTVGFYRGRKQLKVTRRSDLRLYPDT